MSERLEQQSSTGMRGQVAIVTGAGQGLGRAEALALAAEGVSVVVNDVLDERASRVVEEIRQAGGRAVADASSVMTPEGGQQLTRTAVHNFGTVDIVVNNAGFLRPGNFEDLTIQDINDVLDVHLRAAFYVTQPAWSVMKAKGYGRVVMTGSSAGMFSQAANSNYVAAKAGIFGLARALATEGEEFGVKVNAVLPFAATMISTNNPIPGNQAARERVGASYEGEILNRREPSTVTPLIVHLASPECVDSGDVFSACAGRFARAFVALGPGWVSPSRDISVEHLRANWHNVRRAEPLTEPRTLFDEVATVIRDLDELGNRESPRGRTSGEHGEHPEAHDA